MKQLPAKELEAPSQVLIRKAISGCLEVQNYARPLVSASKYQKGVQFEQKLSTLLHLASKQPACQELKIELERVDDLMFQLKYMCMAPMFSTMEEIEGNLNHYLTQQNQRQQQQERQSETKEESMDGPIIEFMTNLVDGSHKSEEVQKGDYEFTPEDISDSSLNEATSVDTFGEEDGDSEDGFLATLRRSSHHTEDGDRSKFQDASESSGQFDTIVEEPSDRDDSDEEDPAGMNRSPAKVAKVRLTDALCVSQGTIDGLLDAFDGSGDTLDLIEATLKRDDKEIIKCHRTFDAEAAAAESALDDSTGDVSISIYPGSQSDSCTSDGMSTADSTGHDAVARKTALVREHQKKFFDRLHHLFEVREKVEQRMHKIDPSGKSKEIEITVHSSGIQLKDGTYKVEYQQQDSKGNVARTLSELYAAAEQANSNFLELVHGAVDKVKGLDRFDAFFPPLKPVDRANEKAKSDYAHRRPGPPEAWLYDVLRATITCKTVKQMESLNKYLCKKAHIVQGKNRFRTPAFTGYRDLLYHVRIPHGFSSHDIRIPHEFRREAYFVAEIQILHKDVIAVEKLLGLNAHRLYFRSCFSGQQNSMTSLLNGLARLDKKGAVDEEFVKSLLDSDDVDQMMMFAEIFHEKLDSYEEALQLYKKFLDREKNMKGDNAWRIAFVHQNMGIILGKRGDFEGATKQFETALSIQKAEFGPEHPEIATTRSHLGHAMSLREDGASSLEDALAQHRTSLSIREKCLGDNHVDVATSCQNVGLTLGQLVELDASLVAYQKALFILQGNLGMEHANVASTHSMIGTILCAQGKFDEARKEFTKALDIRTNTLGKHHLATADSHIEMANMECELGEYDSAEDRYREAWRIRRNALGVDHPDCATVLGNIGYILSQKGDFEGALLEHRAALSIRDAILGKRHPDSLSSRQSMKAAMRREKEV